MSALDSRTKQENMVLSTSRFSITDHAELVVDKTHPFFFDHPQDHIPGLLLLEAAVQMAHASPTAPCFVSYIDASFIRYALFNAPVIISSQVHKTPTGNCFFMEVNQGGHIRAKITVELTYLANDTEYTAGKNVTIQSFSTPCDPKLLNKVQAQNVFIRTPEIVGTKVTTSLLPLNSSCLFTDSAEVLHPLYLMESFMQLQRFLNNKDTTKDRMRDILTGVQLTQRNPIFDKSARITLRGSTVFHSTGPNRLSRNASFIINNRSFAECRIQTALVGRKIQSA